MRNGCCFESLEDRRLMSVTGLSLLGPLPKGGRKVEEIIVGGKVVGSNIETVVGPATFHKIKCTEVKSVTVQGSTTTTDLQYYNRDKAGNIVILGDTITQKTGSTLTKSTTVALTPDLIVFPTSMVFGKTYNFSWTEVDSVTTQPGAVKTITNKTVKLAVKLAAAKEVAVSLPIGKTNAWLLNETIATTIGKKTTTQAVQVWAVPNEGVAKVVIGTGKSAQTFEVTSLDA